MISVVVIRQTGLGVEMFGGGEAGASLGVCGIRGDEQAILGVHSRASHNPVPL